MVVESDWWFKMQCNGVMMEQAAIAYSPASQTLYLHVITIPPSPTGWMPHIYIYRSQLEVHQVMA